MKSSFGWELRSIAALLAVSFAMQSLPLLATDEADAGSFATMKAGLCKFKIIASDGIKPIAGAVLKLTDGKDEKKSTEAVTDKTGKCGIDLAAGRYVLAINGVNFSVIDIKDDATISECRILMPEKPLEVGGDAVNRVKKISHTAANSAVAGGIGTWVVVGSVLVIGGVTYVVIPRPNRNNISTK